MQKKLEKAFQSGLQKTPAGRLIFAYELARTLGFAAQSLSLSFWEMVWTGSSKRFENSEFAETYKAAFKDLTALLQKDSENIRRGIYPWTVLKPRPLRDSLWLYPKVLLDGVGISRRRKNNLAHEFDKEAKNYFNEVPEYYRRNFHFQTGGYLTEQSAEIYDYQVEILFSGAADAMRRLILPALRKRFGATKGEGLHFLEVASGTGRLSHFVKMMYPEARVTLLDLSDAYLSKAREELAKLRRVDFLQGDAADLPFSDSRFDAVYSSFLFHELPLKERKMVLSEGVRVLKPGGFYGFVDSLQMAEKPQYDGALLQFPLDFHEPFYKNYVQHPMEELMSEAGLEVQKSELGFFSKSVSAEKPSPA